MFSTFNVPYINFSVVFQEQIISIEVSALALASSKHCVGVAFSIFRTNVYD